MKKDNLINYQIYEDKKEFSPDFIFALKMNDLLYNFPDDDYLSAMENVDYAIIAEQNSVIVGAVVMYCKSPDNALLKSFFCNPPKISNRFKIMEEMWQLIGDYLIKHRISWITLIPNDDSLKKFFKSLGILTFNDIDMGFPYGIIHGVFKKTNDAFLFKAKSELKDNVLRYWGTRSLTRINLTNGSVQYSNLKHPDVWHEYPQKCGKLVDFNKNDFVQYPIDNPVTDMHVVPHIGHIVLPQIKLIIRAPWWTRTSSEILYVSAHDHDPCEVNHPQERVYELSWKAYGGSIVKPHRAMIQSGDETCSITFSSLAGYDFARIIFESREEPVMKNNIITINDIACQCNAKGENIGRITSEYDDMQVTYFNFNQKEVTLTFKKI